jgi:hypothetical protein
MKRRLSATPTLLVAFFVAATVACDPEAPVEEAPAQVTSPFIIQAGVPLVVTVTRATEWQAFSDQVDFITKPFQQFFATISSINNGIKAGMEILRFLGILSTAPSEIQVLSQTLDQIALGLSADFKAADIDAAMGPLDAAVNVIIGDRNTGVTYTNQAGTWGPTISSMSFLESGSPFTRLFVESATNSTTSWKSIIPSWVGTTRPPVTSTAGGSFVYDWRLGIPALLRAVPMRQGIIAVAVPNYRTDHSYDFEIIPRRQRLFDQYTKMYTGVVCGGSNYFAGTIAGSRPLRLAFGCNIACADIYTGLSAVTKLAPPLSNGLPTADRSCSIAASTPDFRYAMADLRTGVLRQMPFYELQSLIDNLYLSVHPAPDLAELNQRIPLESNQNLCIEIQNGSLADRVPAWLGACNGGTSQSFMYDRKLGVIKNLVLNKCLAVQTGDRQVSQMIPVTTPLPMLDSYKFAVVSTACDGSQEQKWTYNFENRALQNGVGPNVFLSAPGGTLHTLLEARTNMSVIQTPDVDNQWHADSMPIANNHSITVVPSPSAMAGNVAVDAQGESAYWATIDGFILQSRTRPTLSTVTLAQFQTGARDVAVDAKNVYWTDRTASGSVMKIAVDADSRITQPTVLASGLSFPTGIVTDGSYVYFTTTGATANGGSIMRVSVDGTNLATLASGQASPWTLDIDANNVYWATYSGAGPVSSVMAIGKVPGNIAYSVADRQNGPWSVKTDGTNVYWLNVGADEVMRSSVFGGNATVIGQGANNATSLSVSGGALYWATYSRGTVMTVPTGGGVSSILAGGVYHPYATATDASNIYVTTDGPWVMKVAKAHPTIIGDPARPSRCGYLGPNEGLIAGTTQSAAQSCDGLTWLVMQNDGNLVTYQGSTPKWASNTVGTWGNRAIMQADGNFVIYNPAGTAVWATNTGGSRPLPFLTFGEAGHGDSVVVHGGSVNGGFTWSSTSVAASTRCGVLTNGQGLRKGESLLSCDGRFMLLMQSDGNLVLVSNLTGVLWSSNTFSDLTYASVAPSGVLGVFSWLANSPLWTSGPLGSGNVNATVVVQDDGNLTVTNGSGVLTFATNTGGR